MAATSARVVVVFQLPASQAPVMKETSRVMVAPYSLERGGGSQRRTESTYMPSSRGKVSVMAGM